MTVNVEVLEKLERKISLTLSMLKVQEEVNKRLQRLARTVKMDGFRPGKVPLRIVAGQYGAAVQYEVINEHAGQAFFNAATEAGLRVAGQPTITQKEDAAEGEMQLEAVFEVFPEVQLDDVSALSIEKVSAEVDETAIDRTVEILRKQRRTFSQRAADQGAQDGDRVTVDFEGKIDGEPFDGGKAEDFQYLVGEGQMLKEFEDAVRGMKAGESKTFQLAFPDDYHGKEVAGKTADFMVTVKKIEAAHMPEVDDAFAKALGVVDGTVASLRADIRKNLEREVKYRVLARNKTAVMDALLEKSDLELPKAAVQAEIAQLREGMIERLRAQGVPVKDENTGALFEDSIFQEQAQRRVRLGLIVRELVRANNLTATSEQVKAHVEDMAASYEQPAAVVAWYMGDRERLADVEAIVTENNVAEFVLGKAKVTDKAISFDDLMVQQQ